MPVSPPEEQSRITSYNVCYTKLLRQEIENIELVFLSIDDYDEMKEAMIEAYANMPNSYWKPGHIKSLISKFPEGQVVIKVNGQFAGCALSIIV